MTSTAIQKIWMKDLPLPVVAMAKKKAVEATAAWNSTVAGILTAAKAVYEVREKIGGAPKGSFGAWAVEELKQSPQTAYQLARIGQFHNALWNVRATLPPSWGTLYELAKAPDEVARRALRRVRPDMERNEVICLLMEESVELPQKQVRRAAVPTRGKPQLPAYEPHPKPREAATTTIMAGSVWRLVKDFSADAEHALASGALSPEAKAFMIHNYIGPSREQLGAIEKLLADYNGEARDG